ncbi:MAG: RHS repeat-associated core domain-containing protein [Chloroflexi bacterium]|nr:RHS repeat-associated core domain-containing protein [Chloroflexota bacterium]
MLNSTGGSFLEEYDYNTSTISTKFAYTGQQYDDASGLYFLRARYYDPAIGRFLSQDPYPVNMGNPVELNRYVYTANNPVNFADPSGLTGFAGTAIRIATISLASVVVMAALAVAITAAIAYIICYLSGECGLLAAFQDAYGTAEDVKDTFSDFVNGPMDWGDWPGGGRGPRLDPIGAFGRIVKVIAKFATGIALVLSAAVWIAGQVIRHVAPRVIPWLLPHTRIKPKPEKQEECDPKSDPICDEYVNLYRGTKNMLELNAYQLTRIVWSKAGAEAIASGEDPLSTSRRAHQLLVSSYGSEAQYAYAHTYQPDELADRMRRLRSTHQGQIINKTFISWTENVATAQVFSHGTALFHITVPRRLLEVVAVRGSLEEQEWLFRHGVAARRIR